MAYKLAIADKVGVKVKGTTVDASGKDLAFEFTLVCARKSNEEMRGVMSDKERTAQSFFEEVASDWRGQSLVLGDDDKPADFSIDALRLLLDISGMAALCWHCYVQQVQATAKN